MARGTVDGTIREWKQSRWPFLYTAVALMMAIVGTNGVMLGSIALDGVIGAVVGGALGIGGVYSSHILLSVSREMIAPYAKPPRIRRSP